MENKPTLPLLSKLREALHISGGDTKGKADKITAASTTDAAADADSPASRAAKPKTKRSHEALAHGRIR